jgi:HSP20 family molecular chaperone IbpA
MTGKDMVANTNEEGKTSVEKRLNYVTPAVDILENEHGFALVADIPGVEKDQLNIDVEQGVLTLEAKVSEHYLTEGSIFSKNNCEGYFKRFKLSGQFDEGKIDATLKNGVLAISVPKAEVAKPKRIEVTVH